MKKLICVLAGLCAFSASYAAAEAPAAAAPHEAAPTPVSYTHLTLPTNSRV